MKTILVTGGLGFIGLNFIRQYKFIHPDHKIYMVDMCSRVSNEITEVSQYCEKVDIGDVSQEVTVKGLFERQYDHIVHFAAQSHVDESIKDPDEAIQSNVIGTAKLLRHASEQKNLQSFVYISTDEVFGSAFTGESFNERSRLNPNSPYSASKAAGEMLCTAFHTTFKLPVVITNCTNNYGPYQHKEKLIPRVISCIQNGSPIPVFGTGVNVRDWIHVDDHCGAICAILEHWNPSRTNLIERFCIGAQNEWRNIDLISRICEIADSAGMGKVKDSMSLITHVKDRKGHDFRYAIDPTHFSRSFNWKPKIPLATGLKDTVLWYRDR